MRLYELFSPKNDVNIAESKNLMGRITHANRMFGIILPNGKTVTKNSGYTPGAHHDMASTYGFKNAKDLTRKGGVRFCEYEGGVNFTPGRRIEYEYANPSACPLISKHIKENPTSGGYAIINTDTDEFTEYETAANARRFLATKRKTIKEYYYSDEGSEYGNPRNKQAAEYFSIGHGDPDEKTGLSPDFVIWAFLNGKIEKSKKLRSGDPGSHGTLWGHDVTNRVYKGRYEPQTGRLTIVKPPHAEYRDVPASVIDKLYRAFPKIEEIYEF